MGLTGAVGGPPEMTTETLDRLAASIGGWLEEHRKAAGSAGYVVGVSGGVDSALAVTLAHRTGAHTTGLMMPCKSAPQDLEIADAFLRAAGIDRRTVVLDRVFDEEIAALISANVFHGPADARAVAMANIKPRLRMTTLYAFANENKRLVVGTGNRSEDALGYFTKHGDGGVDLLPLADLVKSEVRALARHLGVPDRIVDRIPTAGLWLGQTDEEEMGVTYAQIEEYLREFDFMLEGWHGGSEREVHEALAKKDAGHARIAGMAISAAHKNSYPPVFPAREILGR